MSSSNGGSTSGSQGHGQLQLHQMVTSTGADPTTIEPNPAKRPAYLDNPMVKADYPESEANTDEEDSEREKWTDQACDLPKWDDSTIIEWRAIEKLKANGSNLMKWKRDVNAQCLALNVSQVLRWDLHRPRKHSENRDNWRHWSGAVSHWMVMIMETKTTHLITKGVKELPSRADDLLRAINKHFTYEDPTFNAMCELVQYDLLDSCEFGTAIEFMEAFMKRLERLEEYDARPAPFSCLVKLYWGIHRKMFDLDPIRIELEALGHKQAPMDMTWDQFFIFYKKIESMAKSQDR